MPKANVFIALKPSGYRLIEIGGGNVFPVEYVYGYRLIEIGGGNVFPVECARGIFDSDLEMCGALCE